MKWFFSTHIFHFIRIGALVPRASAIYVNFFLVCLRAREFKQTYCVPVVSGGGEV